MSEDYIVRAMAADNQIRAFAITSRNIVETARQHHNTSPVATAALGRLLTGGAMMGVMMKGDDDILTLMMKGDGPINGVTVTADSHGNVKGYVGNPNVIIPANYAMILSSIVTGLTPVINSLLTADPIPVVAALITLKNLRIYPSPCIAFRYKSIP